jgi:hypothetical protein
LRFTSYEPDNDEAREFRSKLDALPESDEAARAEQALGLLAEWSRSGPVGPLPVSARELY